VFIVCIFHDHSISIEPCCALCVLSTRYDIPCHSLVTDHTGEKSIVQFDCDVHPKN
jgi:hypothetical protein